jgi:hypothetical protein
MTKNQHRARARLDAMSGVFRWIFKALSEIREHERSWPDYIYVPLVELAKRLPKFLSQEELMFLGSGMSNGSYALASFLSTGTMLATWRITQGIYRFDKTLYPHLIDTDVGKIPVDVLCHLPEWCVYLETPGLMMPDKHGPLPMHGAWVRIETKEQDSGKMVLAIMPDVDRVDYEGDVSTTARQITSMLPTQDILISPGSTVKDSIAAILDQWVQDPVRSDRSGLGSFGNASRDEIIDITFNWVNPIINLLLYLCAGADYAGPAPSNPQPKKTKRHGVKIFPANNPTVWDVGVRMGATLRAAHAERPSSSNSGGQSGQVGRHVRPHYRRAHWHIVLSGPRLTPDGKPIPTQNRRSELQWRLRTAVNAKKRASDDDNMPAVIRPVK